MAKYIDADRLRAELEKLYNGEIPAHDPQCDYGDGYFTGISRVFDFIDSLQQEQPSLPSDIDEAAKEFAKTTFKKPYSDNPDEEVTIVEPDKYAGFIAGAKWDREQMMSKAVECIVEDWNPEPHPEITIPLNPEEFSNGNRVHIIIVKEDVK